MSQYPGFTDIKYQTKAADLLKQFKQRSYEIMRIGAGDRILDVGCGTGTDTLAIGDLVGPDGWVMGVDFDPAMVAEGKRRAEEKGVSKWVQHNQAEATSLPFEANSFDASRSDRLFQHMSHPEQALAEMVRITRTGGRILVCDPDWGTASADSLEVDVERRLARYRAERFLRNGFSGRQLYRLFKGLNLQDITLEGFVITMTNYAIAQQMHKYEALAQDALRDGVVTSEEVDRYFKSFNDAERAGTFFASLSIMMVAGRKA